MELTRGAVIIPAYGKEHLTDAVVDDCLEEGDIIQTIVVDNTGQMAPDHYGHTDPVDVITAPSNLGWLRGTNIGFTAAVVDGSDWLIALNNDTRLSRGFFAGLRDALEQHPNSLVAPCYDDHVSTQNNYYRGPLAEFEPQPHEQPVPLIDGTCFALTTDLYRRLGPMDERRFGHRGWGGIEDYILRVRELGGDAVVTRRSYLTHARGSTAREAFSAYERYAAAEMRHGLRRKHGRGWRKHFTPTYPATLDSARTMLSDTVRLTELRLGIAERQR